MSTLHVVCLPDTITSVNLKPGPHARQSQRGEIRLARLSVSKAGSRDCTRSQMTYGQHCPQVYILRSLLSRVGDSFNFAFKDVQYWFTVLKESRVQQWLSWHFWSSTNECLCKRRWKWPNSSEIWPNQTQPLCKNWLTWKASFVRGAIEFAISAKMMWNCMDCTTT